LDIRQLELLVAVVDLASVTRAAEKMHLSAGAISLQLHNLANELQTELFVRSGRQLLPTPAGLRLAEHGRSLVRQMRQIMQEFSNNPEVDSRPFHFATGATALLHRLGRPLRLLRKQYPLTTFDVTVLPTEDIVAGLIDRRFDLGLISLPFPHTNLRVIPLYEEELLVVKPSHRSQTAWHVGNISAEEVGAASFLLYPKRSNMRTLMEGYFQELNIAPRIVMEADDTEAIKRLVEAGFAWSILPEYALRTKPRFFQPFRVDGKRIKRTQALAMAETDYPRALANSIALFLQTELATH
jgi:LysR family transcriptional regulator, nitrogen assimilation regulatory protein